MNFRPLKELGVMVMALSVICFTFASIYLLILGILSVISMNWYIPSGVIKYIIVCIALIITFFIIKIAK
jgi:hypothetical protein